MDTNTFIDPRIGTTIDTQVEFEIDLPRMLDKEFAVSIQENMSKAGESTAYAS